MSQRGICSYVSNQIAIQAVSKKAIRLRSTATAVCRLIRRIVRTSINATLY